MENWVKAWTTEYAFFSADLFGVEYTDIFWKELGIGFTKVVFESERGLVTAFRLEEEIEMFSQKIAEKLLLERGFKKKLERILTDTQSEFERLFKVQISKAMTAESLSRFVELHKLYLPYYVAVLWAPNNLEKVEATKEARDEVSLLCEKLRKKSEPVYPAIETFLQTIFEYIGRREKIESKLLLALSLKEFWEYISSGGLPDSKVLETRYNYSVVSSTRGRNQFFIGAKARSLVERIARVEGSSEITLIKGLGVASGIARGRVRIVFRKEDLVNLKEGEVLVTTMTRPNWLIAMKIAAAYVTEVGGILSHAAIVARELGIPCVIGTKIATKVLKDGDLVEVDTEKGVVKILKRNV